jgi:hypothetical protein
MMHFGRFLVVHKFLKYLKTGILTKKRKVIQYHYGANGADSSGIAKCLGNGVLLEQLNNF